MYICIHIHTCTYIYLYLYAYMYMYIHAYKCTFVYSAIQSVRVLKIHNLRKQALIKRRVYITLISTNTRVGADVGDNVVLFMTTVSCVVK